MMESLRNRIYRLLRFSEHYTKTDMVYLAKSGFWINLNFILVNTFAFLLSIAFANWLTKDTYGTYQYLLSLFSLLGAFTLTGVNGSLTQAIARGHEGTLRASIRPQLLWNLGSAIIALLMSAYYLRAGQAVIGWGLVLIALALPLYNTYNSYTALFVGRKDFRTTFFYTLAVNIPYYLCIFFGVYYLRAALWLIAINLIINTLFTVINYVRAVRTVRNDSVDPETIPFGRHLSYMNFFGSIMNQIDNLFVFHYLGAADLAIYSFVTLIPERAAGPFKSIIAPALPKFALRNEEEVRASFLHKAILMVLASGTCAAAYALLAPWFFRLVYPHYLSAVPYSQIYALTLLGVGANLATTALTAQRKQKELYSLTVGLPLVQLLLQWGGVIWWGLWGLVIAKILSSLVSLIASVAVVIFSRGANGMNRNTTDA